MWRRFPSPLHTSCFTQHGTVTQYLSVWHVLSVTFFLLNQHLKYGERSRRTRFLGDQLDRADAGSWKIADRYATAS